MKNEHKKKNQYLGSVYRHGKYLGCVLKVRLQGWYVDIHSEIQVPLP